MIDTPARPNAPGRAMAAAWLMAAATLGTLPGCVQSDFYGEAHAPTERAELFERLEDIQRPYETIGRLVTIERMASRQALLDAMQRDAARRGAEAIVVTSIEQFAWSDLDHSAELLDPDLAPLAAATDSKLRWRGEALLLRWTDPADPDTTASSPASTDTDRPR